MGKNENLNPGQRAVIVKNTGLSKMLTPGTFVVVEHANYETGQCAVRSDGGTHDIIPIGDVSAVTPEIEIIIRLELIQKSLHWIESKFAVNVKDLFK